MRQHPQNHGSRLPGRRDAQSLVELALALPIMLLMLLAVVDFGRGFFSGSNLQSAAREGARYAASRRCTTSALCTTDNATIRTRVQQAIGSNDPTGAGGVALNACATDPPSNNGKPCIAIAQWDNAGATTAVRDEGHLIRVSVYADVVLVAGFLAEGVDGFAPGLTGLCYVNAGTKVCRIPIKGEAFMSIL